MYYAMPLRASETTSSKEGDATSVDASNPGSEQEEPGCERPSPPTCTARCGQDTCLGVRTPLWPPQGSPVAGTSGTSQSSWCRGRLSFPVVSGCIYQALAGSLPTSRANVSASCGRYNRTSQTSGLKQHKCILLHFWSSKSKPLAGLVLSGGFMETCGIAFPVPRDACILGSSPCPHQWPLLQFRLCPPAPSYTDPYEDSGPTKIMQGNLTILSLTPAKCPLPWKVPYSQVWGIKMRTSLGTIIASTIGNSGFLCNSPIQDSSQMFFCVY